LILEGQMGDSLDKLVKRSWIEFNSYLTNDYRDLLLDLALSHYPVASENLKGYVKQIFDNSIELPGFRPGHVPEEVIVKSKHRFQNWITRFPGIATAIVCLWSEVCDEYIQILFKSCAKNGIKLKEDWSWENGKDGYYIFEDVQKITDISNILTEQYKSPESDHIKLAVLWLSSNFLSSQTNPELELENSYTETREGTSIKKSEKELEKIISKNDIDNIDRKPEISEDLGQVSIMDTNVDLQKELITVLGSIESFIKDKKYSEARGKVIELDTLLKNTINEMKIIDEQISEIFLSLESRPDLKDDSISWLTENRNKLSIKIAFEHLKKIKKKIAEYDKKRKNLKETFDIEQNRNKSLKFELGSWEKSDEILDNSLFSFNPSVSTLIEIQNRIKTLTNENTNLKNRIQKHRNNLENQVVKLSKKILVGGYKGIEKIYGNHSLSELNSHDYLKKINNEDLIVVFNNLEDIINTISKNVLDENIVSILEELKKNWEFDKYTETLELLAKKNLPLETLVFSLTGTSANPNPDLYNFPLSVVKAILDSLEKIDLKRDESFFKFFTYFANIFSKTWYSTDLESIGLLELCFLGAGYDAGIQIPSEIPANMKLWEWPIENTPGWNSIWQKYLIDNTFMEIVIDKSTLKQARLLESRNSVDQVLSRDERKFLKLNSIKSKRHFALLNNTIIPNLSIYQTKLKDLESQINSSNQLSKAKYENLKKIQDELINKFDEKGIIGLYEAESVNQGLKEKESFHKKSSINILNEIVDSLLCYCNDIINIADDKKNGITEVSKQQLLEELVDYPSLLSLGKKVLEGSYLNSTNNIKKEYLPEEDGLSIITKWFLRELPAINRFPRVAGELTSKQLSYSDMNLLVINALLSNYHPDEVSKILIDLDSPNQALIMAPYIDLLNQNHAQELKARLQKEVAELEVELIKNGGNKNIFSESKELGRWNYIKRLINKEIKRLKTKTEEESFQEEEKRIDLLKKFNNLEQNLFEIRQSTPPETIDLIDRGIYIAKNLLKNHADFKFIKDFFDDLDYRIKHEVWLTNDIQKNIDSLENHLNNKVQNYENKGVEEILSVFQQSITDPEKISILGIVPDKLTESEIRKRCEFLEYWQKLKNITGFKISDFDSSDRGVINGLYNSFKEITQLKRLGVENTEHFNYLIPPDYLFTALQLQFPKSDVLRDNCILIAIPGLSIVPAYIRQFEELVNNKQWMEGNNFILLFIPGCTPQIKNRLTSNFKDKGLVILDENRILEIILAAREENSSIGKLRSFMLNTRGAENVDIFKVNELVNSNTGIFVGRENLIRRIINSDSNYALYGGRRIGKSSVLKALEEQLIKKNYKVISYDFQGVNASDDFTAEKLAQKIGFTEPILKATDFKFKVDEYLSSDESLKIAFLFDEVDVYILSNENKHTLIESLRSLSDQYLNRCRVIIAGFLQLYYCLQGKGPYTPSSDPWPRMFTDIGPMKNLRAESAEKIVKEGFIEILGWKFENLSIPRMIVENTGSHPAYVQSFCMKLQQLVAKRGDRQIRVDDVIAIFNDRQEEDSFIYYVKKNLESNLDPIGRYLIYWLANEGESNKTIGFTLGQAKEYANTCRCKIPEDELYRSLEELKVNSVIEEKSRDVFEFSVPDYPYILKQLGETRNLDELERKIEEKLNKKH